MEDGQGCRQSSYLTTEPLEGREGGSGVGTPHRVLVEEPTHLPAAPAARMQLCPQCRGGMGWWDPAASPPTRYSHRGTGDPLQSITELATPGRELPATRILGDLGIIERALQR